MTVVRIRDSIVMSIAWIHADMADQLTIQISDEPIVYHDDQAGLCDVIGMFYLELASNIEARVPAKHVVEQSAMDLITKPKRTHGGVPTTVVKAKRRPFETWARINGSSKDPPLATRSGHCRQPPRSHRSTRS